MSQQEPEKYGVNLFGLTPKQKMEKEERKKIKERKELDENLKDKPYDSITNDDLGGAKTRRIRKRPRKSKRSKKSRKSRKHRK